MWTEYLKNIMAGIAVILVIIAIPLSYFVLFDLVILGKVTILTFIVGPCIFFGIVPYIGKFIRTVITCWRD